MNALRMHDLWLDLRYAARTLRKSPAFTATAVVMLVVAVGINAVVLGVLNAALVRPLAIEEPGTLFQIRTGPPTSGAMLTTSYPAYRDMQERVTTFQALAAVNSYAEAALAWRGTVAPVRGCEVSGNYFEMLRVQPRAGRLFRSDDEHGAGAAPIVVLSEPLWRSMFGADEAVIGSAVLLNQHPFTIVGVAPARFHGTERFERPDFWIPVAHAGLLRGSSYLESRTRLSVMVLGRLKSGASPSQATDELNAVAADLERQYPRTDAGVVIRLIRPGLYGDDGVAVGRFVHGVVALALLLLLATCANLAGLFAARTSDRARDLALRVALGSSGLRVARQLVLEAVLIAVMAGGGGLVAAGALLANLGRWLPSSGYGGQHLVVDVTLDLPVIGATLVLTLSCALAAAMIPASRAWRCSPLSMINGKFARGSGHARRFAAADWLLGAQIALCAVLITAALVAGRGVRRAMEAPLGIRPDGTVLASCDFRQAGSGSADLGERTDALLDAARALPGTTAVGAARATPMGGGRRATPVYAPGTTEFTPAQVVLATRAYAVSEGYLHAAGTTLLRGRDFTRHDGEAAERVALVNETFARRMWSDAAALGARFVISGRLTEVVGVVEDGKYHDLMEPPQPAVFLPLAQTGGTELVLVVRSTRPAREAADALRQSVASLEPGLPVNVRPWSEALWHVLFPARAAGAALGVLGVLAGFLAGTGIFGMAAYGVSRRLREFGVRVALGATPWHVVGAAAGRPLLVLCAGSVLGLLIGVAAGGLLGRVVYQADPGHPGVLAGALATMVLIGVAGCLGPVFRAVRVDPASLLRQE